MQPTFKTERLTLRPFELSDSQQAQRLAGDSDIAKTTLSFLTLIVCGRMKVQGVAA